MAEGTQGLLKVGSNASVTAYKSAGENTYSAAFISTTSSTLPFTGNLETELALTANSGIEGETTEWENVIYESNYVAQDWEGSHQGRGRKENTALVTEPIYTGSDLTKRQACGLYPRAGEGGKDFLAKKNILPFKLLPLTDLKRTLCLRDIPTSGETISAKIGDISSMTVLIKDGQRFYWGVDPNHSQWLVYQTAVDDVTAEGLGSDNLDKNCSACGWRRPSAVRPKKIFRQGYTTNVVKTGMYSYYCNQ